MKKLLGILVLGLLWRSIRNAYHELNQTKETGGLGYWLVVGFLLLSKRFYFIKLTENINAKYELIHNKPRTKIPKSFFIFKD